jgi:hypothetical protein
MVVTITVSVRGITPRVPQAVKYGSFAAVRGMITRGTFERPIVAGVIPDGLPSTVFAVQEISDRDETFSIMTTAESNMNNIWTARLFIFLIFIFFSGCLRMCNNIITSTTNGTVLLVL